MIILLNHYLTELVSNDSGNHHTSCMHDPGLLSV
jgi:hypothetical protein